MVYMACHDVSSWCTDVPTVLAAMARGGKLAARKKANKKKWQAKVNDERKKQHAAISASQGPSLAPDSGMSSPFFMLSASNTVTSVTYRQIA